VYAQVKPVTLKNAAFVWSQLLTCDLHDVDLKTDPVNKMTDSPYWYWQFTAMLSMAFWLPLRQTYRQMRCNMKCITTVLYNYSAVNCLSVVV